MTNFLFSGELSLQQSIQSIAMIMQYIFPSQEDAQINCKNHVAVSVYYSLYYLTFFQNGGYRLYFIESHICACFWLL